MSEQTVTIVTYTKLYNDLVMIDFSLDAPKLARLLIGYELIFTDSQEPRGGIIIETEAYTQNDPASHSYRGPTQRNAAMFMSPGTVYMYRIYGMHECLNIVCGSSDGQAVLIRALQPTRGIAYMRQARANSSDANLCSGPAKLVQALGLQRTQLNGRHIREAGLQLQKTTLQPHIMVSPRIGITKATDIPWRFFVRSL